MSQKRKAVAKSTENKMKSICILAETELGNDKTFYSVAKDLFKEMSKRKIDVVYGGGIQGLGASVAMSALYRGSNCLGVILADNGASSSASITFTLGRELKENNAHDRLVTMLQNSDAVIVMPGGIYNMQLFSSIMIWAKHNVHRKPIGFLNVNGFFDSLLAFFTHAGHKGFNPPEVSCLMTVSADPGQLIDQLQSLITTPSILNQVEQETGEKRRKEGPNDKGKEKDLDLDLRL